MTQRENNGSNKPEALDGFEEIMELTQEERVLVQAMKDPVYKERIRQVLFPVCVLEHLN